MSENSKQAFRNASIYGGEMTLWVRLGRANQERATGVHLVTDTNAIRLRGRYGPIVLQKSFCTGAQ